jgi:hypothetical protein
MQLLPFDSEEFDWKRFERFSLAVAGAMPDVRRADKYGLEGERQEGIDIEVELDDGRTRSIQCRRRKRFPVSSAEKLVRETVYKADEHEVWVTCKTGTAVSKFFRRRKKWQLRDAEHISQLVRGLPRESGRRIVEDAFGTAVRRAFLGPEGPIAFASPTDYFAPLDAEDRAVRHDLQLVGRRSELKEVVSGVLDAATRVVLVSGRGGIGKTRLLRAVAQALEEEQHRVLFALDGVPLDADAVDDLPLDELVVVVDDAHRPDVGLGPLLATAVRREPRVTPVLALRPGGIERIETQLAAAGLEPQQVLVVGPLDALAEDEAQALAVNALGKGGNAAERLAEATAETPLLTVLGGRLVAARELAGAGMSVDSELRRQVLARFKAEQLGRVSDRVPADQALALAAIVAALAPLNVEHDAPIALIAGELGVRPHVVRRWLSELEAAGLLLARGRLRRIVPDVLADQVLYDACLDKSDRSTGYVDELWERYSALGPEALLSNLAELDWRTANGEGDLLDAIWQRITRQFENGDAWVREQALDKLVSSAIYQPSRILALCHIALRKPSATTNWGEFGVTIDDTSVRLKLPGVLRSVGMHVDHVREAMELLWQLARDDGRETNPWPDHAIRVLGDLGGYAHSGRDPVSAVRQAALMDLIERHIEDDDVDEHAWSPLDLLGPLLAREGTTTRARGLAWQLGSYNVRPAETLELRRRIRRLLIAQALNGTPRQRTLAAKTLGEALVPPRGYFGNSVPQEVYDGWETDEHEILDAISEIEKRSHDPSVRHELTSALEWHADHGPWPTVQSRAQELLGKLAGSDEELVAAIADPWGILDLEEQRERIERVARRLLTEHSDGESLAQAVSDLVDALVARKAAGSAEPYQVLQAAARLSPDHARGMWRWMLAHPDAPLTASGSTVLDELRRSGDRDVLALARPALESGRVELRRVVAGYLSGGAWFAEPEQWERELLEEFVADEDHVVRHQTATTLLRIKKHHPQLALALSLKAPVTEDSGRDLDMVFATIDEAGVEHLDQEQRKQLVSKLVAVPDLEYFGIRVLASLGSRDPDSVVDVFGQRLRSGREANGYRPIPFNEFQSEPLADADKQTRRRVVDSLLLLGPDLNALDRRELGKLVWKLTVPGIDDADPDDKLLAERSEQIETALDALEGILETGERGIETATAVLFEMPWQIILDRYRWIAALLDRAQAIDAKHADSLGQSFFAGGIGGLHGRSMGEASPRWVRTADIAREALNALPPGSPGHRLFTDLLRAAERELEDDRKEDDEMEAGWS